MQFSQPAPSKAPIMPPFPATRTLADFAASLDHHHIPAPVRHRARLLLADSLASGIRAGYDAQSTPALLAAFHALGQSGDHAVLGRRERFSPLAAAAINGTLIHTLDFDDTHAAAALHPGAPVVPAVLAAIGMTGGSGQTALTAIILGYEAICRISLALGPSDHYNRGFHPTATCGALAAALAAGKVLGLDGQGMAHALGLVIGQSAGSLQFLECGGWTKRFQVGNAAAAGVVSATLAAQGFQGAAAALEGEHGFFIAHAPRSDPALIGAGLGRHWETLDVAVKPYPACRFSHAALDGILDLRHREHLTVADIAAITIGLPEKGLLLVGAPIARKRRPASEAEAQFSLPFAVAAALVDGGLDWDSYARLLGQPVITALMDRVDIVHDAEAEAHFPRRFAAKVAVETNDGRRLSLFVPSPRGERETFPDVLEIQRKFNSLTKPALTEIHRDHLFAQIMAMDNPAPLSLPEFSSPT